MKVMFEQDQGFREGLLQVSGGGGGCQRPAGFGMFWHSRRWEGVLVGGGVMRGCDLWELESQGCFGGGGWFWGGEGYFDWGGGVAWAGPGLFPGGGGWGQARVSMAWF